MLKKETHFRVLFQQFFGVCLFNLQTYNDLSNKLRSSCVPDTYSWMSSIVRAVFHAKKIENRLRIVIIFHCYSGIKMFAASVLCLEISCIPLKKNPINLRTGTHIYLVYASHLMV